ncbi:MAG TPA: hypothetical protein VIM00_09335 [Candidatus Acidoferrum sp.]|jgi:hypothetical protein
METGTKSASPGWSGRAGLAAFGLVAMALSAGWAANCLGALVWKLAGYAMRFVPSLVFAAAQGVQAHGFGQCGVMEYFPKLLSCLSTILVIRGML